MELFRLADLLTEAKDRGSNAKRIGIHTGSTAETAEELAEDHAPRCQHRRAEGIRVLKPSYDHRNRFEREFHFDAEDARV